MYFLVESNDFICHYLLQNRLAASNKRKHIATPSDAQVLPFCTAEICPHRSCPMWE
jgi:hypothetical protein